MSLNLLVQELDVLLVSYDDIAATEASVLMLVSFCGHWKYPIGYVFDDKLNAHDLKCLLSRGLSIYAQNHIKIRCITTDVTLINLSAMKLFGCSFGHNLDDIDNTFYHNTYDYVIYFIADPVNMLKLARNALEELKEFTDSLGRKIACQTFSASVADAIEYLMQSGHKDFKNAEGTIEFIRKIDKPFDLTNVRNPFGKGYKQPLRLSNKDVWEGTITSSIN